MAKQRRTTKKDETGDVRNKCVEPVVNFSDEQQLLNHLEWIKFKVNKKMFTSKEIGELLKLTVDYKQI
jgi:hypothetical protein